MSSVAERQKVDDFRLDRDQITTVKVLGSGNFSQVSKAVYKPLNSEVAVKSLKGTLHFSYHFYIYPYEEQKSSGKVEKHFLILPTSLFPFR